jgi:hypothetical protein
MMSYTVSAAWSHPVSSPCSTEHGQHHGTVLLGHIITVAISRSGQLVRRCTIEPNCSGLSARLAGASVTRERALETCESSYVSGAARPFFIPVDHSPLGAAGYVVHRSSPLGEAELGAMGHVAASELTLSGRQGPELRDAWQRRSSPQQGGEVWGRGTRGGAESHLCSEVWSEATAYVTIRGCTPCSLSLT